MKTIFLILFFATNYLCFGQAKIEMSSVFVFNPAIAGTPQSTITYSSNISLATYVKNTGNATFTGSIKIRAQGDTANGIYNDTLALLNKTLLPNDSVLATFLITTNANSFKTNGNGNVIVVWPIIINGAGLNGDSVRPILWVADLNSVFEFEQKKLFKLYPNPTINKINITSKNQNTFKKISIYDVFSRKVKEVKFDESIDVSDLNAGQYWILINTEDKQYSLPFIKE